MHSPCARAGTLPSAPRYRHRHRYLRRSFLLAIHLLRFRLTHPGIGAARKLDFILNNLPWYVPVFALVGLLGGYLLLRRYDFPIVELWLYCPLDHRRTRTGQLCLSSSVSTTSSPAAAISAKSIRARLSLPCLVDVGRGGC